jgi:hypothetical protein
MTTRLGKISRVSMVRSNLEFGDAECGEGQELLLLFGQGVAS